jgi:hypothetical protein
VVDEGLVRECYEPINEHIAPLLALAYLENAPVAWDGVVWEVLSVSFERGWMNYKLLYIHEDSGTDIGPRFY